MGAPAASAGPAPLPQNHKNKRLGWLMTQCEAYMITGGRCELEAGHDNVGPGDPRARHQRQYQHYVATWTDEDSRRSAVLYSSRFD